MTPDLNHYERRHGTLEERQGRREAHRADQYRQYRERQARLGLDPVPYDRFGLGPTISSGDLTEADRERYGLPSGWGRGAHPFYGRRRGR